MGRSWGFELDGTTSSFERLRGNEFRHCGRRDDETGFDGVATQKIGRREHPASGALQAKEFHHPGRGRYDETIRPGPENRSGCCRRVTGSEFKVRTPHPDVLSSEVEKRPRPGI
jgi:hypothetical protein